MDEPKRGRGRQIGYKHHMLTRERIRTGYLLSRLNKHVRGEIEMSTTQLRAAEILLKKALPDLASVEHTGAIEHRNVRDLSDAELLTIAASGLARVDDEAEGEGESRSLHQLLDS
jgi:hypothetical protein